MPPYSWTIDPAKAEREQLNLRELIKPKRSSRALPPLSNGIAIGTAYDPNSKHSVAVGLRFDLAGAPAGKPAIAAIEVDFPYVPGLLAYRVGPAVCSLLDEIGESNGILIFDGQGIAHPRGFGLASHIGVLYDRPAIGVTRNHLFGDVIPPPSRRQQSTQILQPSQNTKIGYALVLRDGCNPCYISAGHLLSSEDALELVCGMEVAGDGFPSALERAHALANRYAKTNWHRDHTQSDPPTSQ